MKLLELAIKHRTLINEKIERVYDTITSSDEWDRFFTSGMKLEARPGGICEFAWKEWGPDKVTVRSPGEVVRANRPFHFVFKWGSNERATLVSIELEPTDRGTIVSLVDTGYIDDEAGRTMIMDCAAGWGEALTLLKFYLEEGITYDKRIDRVHKF